MLKHRKLKAAVICGICVTSFNIAIAEEWRPNRPVRIVVPIVGSTNDAIARIVAPKLAEAFKQPFIVENKPGAGGSIGANEVAKSTPDGQTILVGYNGPLAINVTLMQGLPYDPIKAFAPITLAVKAPQYLVVGAKTGIKTLAQFLSLAKSNPGKYSYASVSQGSASHLTMEMFKAAGGFNYTHIPYKGAGPAITDLLAGNVEAGFFVPGNVLQFIKNDSLIPLASTGRKRFEKTPNVPTFIEAGFKDFEATSWVGFLLPSNTPAHIVNRYHVEFKKILSDPEVVAKLKDMEYEIVSSTPEEFRDWIESEIQRWGKVVKATGTKME